MKNIKKYLPETLLELVRTLHQNGFSKIFTIIFLYLLNFSSSHAQLPFYKQFTVNDGLPGSELFDVTQDNFGRIWFASNNGVGYYDGYSFKIFSSNEGLADNTVIRILHGKNDKLWFLSYSGKLSYYQNGKILPYQGNDLIFQYGDRQGLIRSMNIDSFGNIWFMANVPHKICKITPELKIETIDTNLLDYSNFQIFLIFDDQSNKKYFNSYVKQLRKVATPLFVKQKLSDRMSDYTIHPYKIIEDEKCVYFIDNKYYTLNHDYRLKLQKNNKLKYEYYLAGLKNYYKDGEGNIWIRISNDGILKYPENSLYQKPIHLFKNLRVTRILKDKDNNYWISTDGDGLFLVPAFQFTVFNKSNGIANDNILSFDIHGSNLYFSTNDNNVYKAYIENGKIKSYKKFFPTANHLTYGRNILCHSDGSIWVITSLFLKYDSTGRKIPLNVIIRNKLYQAIELHDHSTVIASKHGFFKYIGSQIVYDSREDAFDEHILTVFQDKKGIVWLGTMDGLYKVAEKRFDYMGNKDFYLKGRITSINECGDYLIVGNHDKGLVILSNNDSVFHPSKTNELIGNPVKTLCAENDTILWVGTNKGISKIIFSHSAGKLHLKTTNYTIWDGLPSNEINHIKVYNGVLWIATNNGLASIHISDLKKSPSIPVVFMEYVLLNDKDTLSPENHQLKYYQNNINFFYKAISFNGPGDITYKIKLNNIDHDWITTRNTSARYTGLPAGNYVFYVKAANSSGFWSKNTATFRFAIKKHFTREWWFILLIILVGLLTLTGIFLLILRNQHIKGENKRKLLLSEQKALRSQMNPHFIFNSLSSIQYLVLKGKLKEAGIYLSRFSSLMRKVLENSKYNTIPLSEEIETLKLYLELEKMRFEDKFDYQIIIDPSISTEEFRIPPMLIQPYLENAIWHGFMLKKTKGFLILNIEKYYDDGIKCIIEDNGIGREEAGKLSAKRKNHKPTGIQNIDERITLINKIYKTKMKVEITDLYNTKNQAKGTRVILYITKLFDF